MEISVQSEQHRSVKWGGIWNTILATEKVIASYISLRKMYHDVNKFTWIFP